MSGPASGSDARLTSTTRLIERAQAGDGSALHQLFDRYLPQLYRWASALMYGRAWGPHDPRDVAHNAALRLLRALPQFRSRGEGTARHWIASILWNGVRDLVRRQKARPYTTLDIVPERPDPQPSTLDTIVARDDLERYRAALSNLSSDERRAVVLRIEQGWPMERIAAALGRPSPDAARMLLRRALRRLARSMSDARP